MKKRLLALLGVIVVFVTLEVVLENLLGISFPNMATEVAYDIFKLVNGAALLRVIQRED